MEKGLDVEAPAARDGAVPPIGQGDALETGRADQGDGQGGVDGDEGPGHAAPGVAPVEDLDVHEYDGDLGQGDGREVDDLESQDALSPAAQLGLVAARLLEKGHVLPDAADYGHRCRPDESLVSSFCDLFFFFLRIWLWGGAPLGRSIQTEVGQDEKKGSLIPRAHIPRVMM